MPPTQRQNQKATGPLTDNQASVKYGLATALINSNKSLRDLWERAKKGRWTPEKFQTELQKTAWYKNHAESWRRAETQFKMDRKTYDAEVAAKAAEIKRAAASMGATLTDTQIKSLADSAYRFGYNEAQMLPLISAYITTDAEGSFAGAAASNAAGLRALAQANGQTYNDQWYLNAVKAIGAGTAAVETYESQIRADAAGQYGLYSDRILAGENVWDITSNYRTSYANLLELDPDSVSLSDSLMKEALTATDPATGNPAVMSLSEFEKRVKKDPRWAYTDNARDEITNNIMSVGRLMGLA